MSLKAASKGVWNGRRAEDRGRHLISLSTESISVLMSAAAWRRQQGASMLSSIARLLEAAA